LATPPDQHVVTELTRSASISGANVSGPGYASRLHHVEDDKHFTIIALPGAKREFKLCLARGLQRASGRRLRLVLPANEAGSALAWSAYLAPGRRPEILIHSDWANARAAQLPQPADVEGGLIMHARRRAKIDDAKSAVEAELRASSEPKHLGGGGRFVYDLIEWVSRRRDLDPAHRQGYRAWQYRGQKVLEISPGKGGVTVVAGVKGEKLTIGGPLSIEELKDLIARVETGIDARRTGQYRKPDEAWLQSFIGRAPHKVGIESRAFREVPAWRSKGGVNSAPTEMWGRGYVDLLGVDAHGVVRIVETKLPSNSDAPGLGFQAIDYLIYCRAYRAALSRRLDVSPKADFAIRYVLGQEGRTTPRLHDAAAATMRALDDWIEYDVQGLTDWYVDPGNGSRGVDVAVINAPRAWPAQQ
jgi:hypothetical protein